MSDGVYSFRSAPTYRASTREAMLAAAFDRPMNVGSTFFDQAKGGILESFGLGTAVREMATPGGEVTTEGTVRSAARLMNPITTPYEVTRLAVDALRRDSPALDEEGYKASPYFRTEVPWDGAMTEDRAASLADWHDRRKVREYYATKRPITAFIGNLAGQAVDPINYVPVAGPLVKAAAVARLGRVGGAALTGALDAAGNTAMFGIATRDARGRFGDDVSWQATVSQIATAAMLGAAFGTIGGVFEARADTKVRADAERRLSTLKTTQESRVALNEAIDGLVHGEDVRLSPNATEPMARVAQEAERVVARRAGEVDRSWAGATDLGPQTVVTPTGLRVAVRSEVVDAMSLVKASGELQPRDRSRAASDAQISEMASQLDPARLMFSPEADRGAPIIGPDNIVESGNGRVAALVRAAQTNPERFAAYKQALRDAGYDVPETGVPVLVSRRTSGLTPEQRAQFVNDANTSSIARMSATETAQMDVRAMTGATLDNYVPGDINSAANRAFVGSFMKNLPSNERLSLIDADGRLNADGVRRVENALIAAAYGDSDVVARFAESPDDNVKAIMGAMSDAAGDWAAMRKEIADGAIGAEHDVTANLTDALRFISRAREKATKEKRPVATVIREDLGQIDLLAGDIDPRTKAFVQSFYKNDQFTQANGRDIMAEHLSNITRAARELGRPSLFGDAIAVAPSEMIANARPQARQADIFGSGSPRESGGADGKGQEIVSLFGDGAANPARAPQDGLVGSGQPVDTPAFRAWFGASKVVDRSGRPLVVYRGQSAVDWNTGKPLETLERTSDFPSFVDGEPGVRIAAFFSDDPSVANKFSSMYKGGNQATFPVYLSIENPFIIDAKGQPASRMQFGDEGKPFRDAIRSGEYDGVIIKNTRDEGNLFVPLTPGQIKSIFNRGAFDRSDPRIIDTSPPRPDPIPEGRTQAEAAIAKPDDVKAMAKQYGVHPETGAFAEEAEIAQLKAEGRLTDEDVASLDDAKRALDDGEAYGEALKAAVGCLI